MSVQAAARSGREGEGEGAGGGGLSDWGEVARQLVALAEGEEERRRVAEASLLLMGVRDDALPEASPALAASASSFIEAPRDVSDDEEEGDEEEEEYVDEENDTWEDDDHVFDDVLSSEEEEERHQGLRMEAAAEDLLSISRTAAVAQDPSLIQPAAMLAKFSGDVEEMVRAARERDARGMARARRAPAAEQHALAREAREEDAARRERMERMEREARERVDGELARLRGRHAREADEQRRRLEQHMAAIEAERRRREEEERARRERERKEREEREAAEARARAEAEAEAKAKAAAAAAAAKKKAAEEAKAKKPPADKPAAAAAKKRSPGLLKENTKAAEADYVSLVQADAKEVEAADAFKQKLPRESKRISMFVKKKFNQLAPNNAESIVEVAKALEMGLQTPERAVNPNSGPAPWTGEARRYMTFLIADEAAQSGASKLSIKAESSFGTAHVLVKLCQAHPGLAAMMRGRLAKACVASVPVAFSVDQFDSPEVHAAVCGYRADDEGRLETEDAYLERQMGYVRLLAAVCQTEGAPPGMDMAAAWTWLARAANRAPSASSASALLAFLQTAGWALERAYPRQTPKLVRAVARHVVPALGTATEGQKMARKRVELFLEESARGMAEPEGRRISATQKSSQVMGR